MALWLKETIKSFLQSVLLPAVYKMAAGKPVDERLVILSDCHHDKCPYSMMRMRDYLTGNTDYKVMEIYRDYSKGSFYALKESIDFMRHYAVASYVFICDNNLPVAGAKKRKETKVVQLWHAGGALKRFGYDSEWNIPSSYKGGNVFGNYDMVTVSADYAVKPFSSAMRTDEHTVRATGISRTDYCYDRSYIDRQKKKFAEKHPGAAGKKVILWAPTFRGSASDPMFFGGDEIERLKNEFSDRYYIIRKLHPHAKRRAEMNDSDMSSEALMLVCDIMITDYSSILYDYSLLQKPLILFAPDLDTYVRENGFYEDYDSIPAPHVTTYDGLVHAVRDAEESFDADAMNAFRKRTMTYCDGHATERIIMEIMKNENP
ncbi:MAG: CDP-glycerol glycerophosphotransferase family protein [Lachnospiraceae bacterium]|nr:CDP-glycerol glycerophosphotransferase family protein [Lachnospiraceae bacterium]